MRRLWRPRPHEISEDGDVECTVSPDHGYDDLVPPPELVEVTADHDSNECARLLRENQRLDAAIRRALNRPELWRQILETARPYEDPHDDGTWQNGESYQGRWA